VCVRGRGSALGALGITDASKQCVQGSVHGGLRLGWLGELIPGLGARPAVK
jgi:hypothetical protein